MFCLNLHRDLEPDPHGLGADDLHVVGHVLPIRMVIALAFFERIFTQSLPMNQAHGLIIVDVYRTRLCQHELQPRLAFWRKGDKNSGVVGVLSDEVLRHACPVGWERFHSPQNLAPQLRGLEIRCKFPSSNESSLSSETHAGRKRDDGKDVGGRSA
jgi:hypothetical protein